MVHLGQSDESQGSRLALRATGGTLNGHWQVVLASSAAYLGHILQECVGTVDNESQTIDAV